jgi:two-component system, NarL family, nitrate/nitrite response regulator NarL
MYRHGLVDTIKRRPELELVGTAGDGRDALAKIKELAPDVALLDIKMPGLSGVDVLRAVSRDGC